MELLFAPLQHHPGRNRDPLELWLRHPQKVDLLVPIGAALPALSRGLTASQPRLLGLRNAGLREHGAGIRREMVPRVHQHRAAERGTSTA